MIFWNYAKLITGTYFYRNVFLQFTICQLKGLDLKTYYTKRYLLIHIINI